MAFHGSLTRLGLLPRPVFLKIGLHKASHTNVSNPIFVCNLILKPPLIKKNFFCFLLGHSVFSLCRNVCTLIIHWQISLKLVICIVSVINSFEMIIKATATKYLLD